jgi:hypothetical protein
MREIVVQRHREKVFGFNLCVSVTLWFERFSHSAAEPQPKAQPRSGEISRSAGPGRKPWVRISPHPRAACGAHLPRAGGPRSGG